MTPNTLHTSQTTHELVSCAQCGYRIPKQYAVVRFGQHYCSQNCVSISEGKEHVRTHTACK
jgi:hypothetical protein